MEKTSSVTVLAGKWLWPNAAPDSGSHMAPSYSIISASDGEGWREWDKSVQPQAGWGPPRRGFLNSEFLHGKVYNYWSSCGKCRWATPTRVWPPCLPHSDLDPLVECPSALHLSPLPYLSGSWQLPTSVVPEHVLEAIHSLARGKLLREVVMPAESASLWVIAACCGPRCLHLGRGSGDVPSGDVNPIFGTVIEFGSPAAASYATGLSGVLGCSLE